LKIFNIVIVGKSLAGHKIDVLFHLTELLDAFSSLLGVFDSEDSIG